MKQISNKNNLVKNCQQGSTINCHTTMGDYKYYAWKDTETDKEYLVEFNGDKVSSIEEIINEG